MPRFRSYLAWTISSIALISCPLAQANLVINPTWDSTITSDPNAAAIMGTINSAISFYNANFTDNIVVEITFKTMSSGLGASTTGIFRPSYLAYRLALESDATTAADGIALAHLPNQTMDPVTGIHANMVLARANARAIGGTTSPGTDGTVFVNTSVCNLDRLFIDPNKYDLYAVTCHEIDEVLGMGSWIDGPLIGDAAVRAMDLFRYDANGNRSFTNSASQHAYFSLDGSTRIVEFNQSGSGDWGDWIHHTTPQVQDFSGTKGVAYDMGPAEIAALDVIGYNAAPVPEPATLFGLSIGALAILSRQKRH